MKRSKSDHHAFLHVENLKAVGCNNKPFSEKVREIDNQQILTFLRLIKDGCQP